MAGEREGSLLKHQPALEQERPATPRNPLLEGLGVASTSAHPFLLQSFQYEKEVKSLLAVVIRFCLIIDKYVG